MATITVFINNHPHTCDASSSVAGAITQATHQLGATRQSVHGMPRTMLCGMGYVLNVASPSMATTINLPAKPL